MKNRTHYIWMVFFLAGFLVASPTAFCSGKEGPEILLEAAGQCRKDLDGSAKKRKYRHHWLNCIDRYKKVCTGYPTSSQAAWALYRSAELYTGLYRFSALAKDLDEAIALYRTLIDKHKDHALADNAQYRIGEIYYKYRNDPTQAYVEFLKVDVNFPSGNMRPKARQMLNKLAETLSIKERQAGQAEVGSPSKLSRVHVKDIRHWSTPNYTRVVIDLEGPVAYEHHLLKADPDHDKPRRIYMDLKNARIPKGIDSAVPIKSDLLQGARAGQYTLDTVRVVLDIERISGYKVFHLYDPFRIVVDVQGLKDADTKPQPQLTTQKRDVRRGIRKEEAPDPTVSLARQLGLTVKRIVIDPGHGGKDPGCRIGGRYEKDITLDIARLLAQKLREKIGCEVFLTRDKDIFLSLEQRTAIANMQKADLFISLHVNAHKDQRIHGLETYFLNMATDQSAVLVAARENATSEKSISDLQTILNDLMLNTKINESSRLAHNVQNGMVGGVSKSYAGIRSLGVKQAPFYVLIGAEMPAVLVEVGFLSNRRERERLVDKKYQKSITDGIYAGIRSYIKSIDQAYQGG
ncbi:MAG: N-acetylmuramoyl-L-alanine amidase [Candidatus Desulfacyla sp.]